MNLKETKIKHNLNNTTKANIQGGNWVSKANWLNNMERKSKLWFLTNRLTIKNLHEH